MLTSQGSAGWLISIAKVSELREISHYAQPVLLTSPFAN